MSRPAMAAWMVALVLMTSFTATLATFEPGSSIEITSNLSPDAHNQAQGFLNSLFGVFQGGRGHGRGRGRGPYDLPVQSPPSTILGVLSALPSTSFLAAGLRTYPALLPAVTSNETAVTVFAPTNRALFRVFRALNLTKWDANNTVLLNVLRYHVATAPLKAGQLKNRQILPTLLGRNLTVDLRAASLPIIRGRNSAAQVIAVNLPAGKAVIHIIDDVLLPINPFPVKFPTVAAAAVAGNLTSLVAAVQKAGLLETVSNASLEATVFAPTDKAFAAALTSLNLTLETVPVDTLRKILLYHVVPRYLPKARLFAGLNVTTLAGQTLQFTYPPVFVRKSHGWGWGFGYRRTQVIKLPFGPLVVKAFGSKARVVVGDLYAGKAVVHVIDTVLLPNLA